VAIKGDLLLPDRLLTGQWIAVKKPVHQPAGKKSLLYDLFHIGRLYSQVIDAGGSDDSYGSPLAESGTSRLLDPDIPLQTSL